MGTAVVSPCGTYRYHLRRECRTPLDGSTGKAMVFVMLNPSTADATQDDPTVRRCRGFAEREGCASFEIVNLYAYRTPSPKALFDAMAAGVDVHGGHNRRYLIAAIRQADVLVAAWGAHARPADVAEFVGLVESERAGGYYGLLPVWCLGLTRAGQPRHPLMLRADSPLEPWGDE